MTPCEIHPTECVTHFYQDDRGRWWWHCFTCNDGSNKRGRHHRGHARESDAAYGAKQHARDKQRVREARARYADWHCRLMTTDDPAVFVRTWEERWPGFSWRTDLTPAEIMRNVQADFRERQG